MSMCVRCWYEAAASPDADLCEHCQRQATLDRERTAEIARLLTEQHQEKVTAQDEAA